MPSNLSRKIKRVTRSGTLYRATIIETMGVRASVRLSQNGNIVRNLPVSGGAVSVGQAVYVGYTANEPIIYSYSGVESSSIDASLFGSTDPGTGGVDYVGDFVSEGPGIDLIETDGEYATTKQIGVGLDTILLEHNDGSPAEEFEFSQAGFESAVQAGDYQEVIHLPSGTLTLTNPTAIHYGSNNNYYFYKIKSIIKGSGIESTHIILNTNIGGITVYNPSAMNCHIYCFYMETESGFENLSLDINQLNTDFSCLMHYPHTGSLDFIGIMLGWYNDPYEPSEFWLNLRNLHYRMTSYVYVGAGDLINHQLDYNIYALLYGYSLQEKTSREILNNVVVELIHVPVNPWIDQISFWNNDHIAVDFYDCDDNNGVAIVNNLTINSYRGHNVGLYVNSYGGLIDSLILNDCQVRVYSKYDTSYLTGIELKSGCWTNNLKLYYINDVPDFTGEITGIYHGYGSQNNSNIVVIANNGRTGSKVYAMYGENCWYQGSHAVGANYGTDGFVTAGYLLGVGCATGCSFVTWINEDWRATSTAKQYDIESYEYTYVGCRYKTFNKQEMPDGPDEGIGSDLRFRSHSRAFLLMGG